MAVRTRYVRRVSQAAIEAIRPSRALVVVGVASLVCGAAVGRWLLPSRNDAAAASAPQAPPPARTLVGKPGPWGQFRFVRIGIEPPPEHLDAEQDFGRARWFFGGLAPAEVQMFLRSLRPEAEVLRALIEDSAWAATPEGTWVAPTDQALLDLDPDTRSRIYGALSPFSQNSQRHPVPLRPDSVAERMATSGLPADSLALVRRLMYPAGAWVFFADAPFVLGRLPRLEQRRRFIAMLARNSTYLVTLSVDDRSDVDSVARYWSPGGRLGDAAPLLRSLTRVPGGSELDLAHLLPPMARRRIFTYAHPPPGGVVDLRNCFWTAMNFWNEQPEDRFTDAQEMMTVLRADYQRVVDPSYGDVLVLMDRNGAPFHAASYLADELVFTKNGHTQFHPWMYATVDELRELYAAMSPRSLPFELVYWRRRAAPP
jgi:hypothetical protein